MGLIRRLLRDQRGGSLVEYAFAIPMALALLLAVFDFGHIYLRWILAEKATHHAARIAAVRPPICPGVPEINERADPNGAERFGAPCAGGICVNPGAIACDGAGGDPTVDELFADIAPMLPGNPTPANLRFTYDFSGIGFLGGPYVPQVSVELQNLTVPYLTPFAQLFRLYGAGGGAFGPLTMPPMRASMPGEDLNQGPLG
jgi:hypothetical protein